MASLIFPVLLLFAFASEVFSTLSSREEPIDPVHNPCLYDSLFTRRILAESSSYGNFSVNPTPGGNFTVGIIGAGASGLYSAILLESLGIGYEILEADIRAGGRIWTYYFDEKTWEGSSPGDPEYYDYYVSTIEQAL